MTDQTTRSVQVRITGRVQGVWFRAWTEENARELGLAGWVRNRSDGTVEAAFHGPSAAVSEMLERCRAGPPRASVSAVEIITEDLSPPDGFHVLRTA